MKDEIVQEIADELKVIREELQNLSMAVRAAGATGNETSYHHGSSSRDACRTKLIQAILNEGRSRSEVLNRVRHEANGIKMPQRQNVTARDHAKPSGKAGIDDGESSDSP